MLVRMGGGTPAQSIDSELILGKVVVDNEDKLATHIRYTSRSRHYCSMCHMPFSSQADLRIHKQINHSY